MSDKNKETHGDNQFWIGIFLGGLLGAILIVLMGTEKGRKIAKKIEEQGLDFLDDAATKLEGKVDEIEDKSEALIEKSQQLAEEGRELEAQIVQKVVEVKEDMADQVVQKADETLAHIEALQERGRKSTAELRKRLFKNIPKKTS